jgi:hypothetical protein
MDSPLQRRDIARTPLIALFLTGMLENWLARGSHDPRWPTDPGPESMQALSAIRTTSGTPARSAAGLAPPRAPLVGARSGVGRNPEALLAS